MIREGKKCSALFAKSQERVSPGRRVMQWDCQYTSIFQDTGFRQQHCRCLLAEMHLITVAFDGIKFDHFIYSSVKCL